MSRNIPCAHSELDFVCSGISSTHLLNAHVHTIICLNPCGDSGRLVIRSMDQKVNGLSPLGKGNKDALSRNSLLFAMHNAQCLMWYEMSLRRDGQKYLWVIREKVLRVPGWPTLSWNSVSNYLRATMEGNIRN